MPQIEMGVKGKDEVVNALSQIEGSLNKLNKTSSMISATSIISLINPSQLLGQLAGKLTSAFFDCAKAAREDAMAQNRLNAALGGVNSALAGQAAQLADVHKLTQGEIVNVQRITANYFQEAETIRKLTPAIMNMSIATGQSADSIAEQLSSAVKSGRGLKQYGLELNNVKSEQERLEIVTNFANERFGDQAKAVTELRSPFDLLGSQIQEAQGNLGYFFMELEKAPVVKAVFEYLNKQLKEFNENASTSSSVNLTKEQREQYKETLKQIDEVEKKIRGLNNLQASLSESGGWDESIVIDIEKLTEKLNILKSTRERLINLSKVPEEKTDYAAKYKKEVLDPEREAQEKTELEMLELKKNGLEKTIELIWQAKEEKIKVEKEGIDETIALLDLQQEKEKYNIIGTKEQIAEQSALIDEKYSRLRAQAYDKEVLERQKKSQDELDNIRKTNNEAIKLEKEKNDAIQAMYDLAGIEDPKSKDSKVESQEQKYLKKKQRKELKDLEDLNNEKLGINKEYLDAKEAMERRHSKETTELTKKESILKTQSQLEYVGKAIGGIGALMKATIASAEATKALASMEALIMGAAGIMGVIGNKDKYIKAYVYPPLATAMQAIEIATIVATTATQVANINSAKMAYGGTSDSYIVTGGKEGQDSVNATLMPGEVVYNLNRPNPYLAQMISNTVPGGIEQGQFATTIYNQVTINGSPSKKEQKELEKAIEEGTLKAIKKAQQKGKLSINNTGKNIIIRK